MKTPTKPTTNKRPFQDIIQSRNLNKINANKFHPQTSNFRPTQIKRPQQKG